MESMESKLVNVRIPQSLYSDATSIVRAEGYASMQELVKESLRTTVQQKLQERAIIEMRKLAGSQKLKKLIPKDEMDFFLLQEWGIISKSEKFTPEGYMRAKNKLRSQTITESEARKMLKSFVGSQKGRKELSKDEMDAYLTTNYFNRK